MTTSEAALFGHTSCTILGTLLDTRERDTVIAEFLGIALFLLLLYIGDYLSNSLVSDRSVARDTRICQRWLLQLGDCTML